MFSDPMVAVMAMLILCFAGMLVMFIFTMRSLSSHAEEMRESFRKQQMFLADIEKQFMDLSFALRRVQEGGASPDSSARPVAGKASGLPIMREDDGLMNMLEAAARNTNDTERQRENGLLPSPSVSRPLAEEYDPAKDPHLFDDGILSGTSPSAAPKGQTGRAPARTGMVGGRGRSTLSLKLDD